MARSGAPNTADGTWQTPGISNHFEPAIARTDCTLQVIDKPHFLFLVQETPLFAIQVMKVMADRLRRVDILVAKSDFERANRGTDG